MLIFECKVGDGAHGNGGVPGGGSIPKRGWMSGRTVKRSRGFTIIEVLTVLVILGVSLVLVGSTFYRYLERAKAKRAAEIFGQDLTAARNMAARSRQTVVMDFDEVNLNYVVRTSAGDTLFRRSFGDRSDVPLSAMDLEISGDTLAFGSRGIADLSGATGPLGQAVFTAGTVTYAVSFNSMGSSRIGGP